MNIIKSLIDRARGASAPAIEDGKSPQARSWHTYEEPVTKDRLRIFNASDLDMPEQMIVGDRTYAHVAPFAGMRPVTPPTFDTGDYVYRHLTQQEREALAEIKVREFLKASKKQGYKAIAKHELRSRANAALAKQRVVFQVQDGTNAEDVLKSSGTE